jgi:hypothetical protein
MIDCSFEKLEGPVKGVVVTGRNAGATGVVVLTGSSGRIDVDRARLFAETGVKALALRWFGGVGQSPGICEIPLETFCYATDYLISIGCQRIVFVGTSKGAEAALLVATIDPRVDVVVAISPTSVVWGNIGPEEDGIAWPERSSWSLKGLPLDFVPADPDWRPEYRDGLISYRRLFEHCLISHEDAVRRARIPIEKPPQKLSSLRVEMTLSGHPTVSLESLLVAEKRTVSQRRFYMTVKQGTEYCCPVKTLLDQLYMLMVAGMMQMQDSVRQHGKR